MKTNTKKAPTKKVVAKKVAKKAVAKAPVKKVVKAPKEKKSKVTLISFTFGATIPTQSFGNIQPQISVSAPSYEEAVEFAIPKIEALYRHYSDVKPHFLGKVTESERTVEVPKATPVAKVASAPVVAPTPAPKVEAPVTASSPAASVPSSSEPTPTPATEVVRSEPYRKAEKAISLAMSHDAMGVIEAQIQKSVKIDERDKPDLYRYITERKNEIPF